MRTIKRNGIMPSDMNSILSGIVPGTYTEDGMESIHQRHYNQDRDFKKIEYKYNNELDDILNKVKSQFPEYEIIVKHNKDDYDTYDILISHYDKTLDGEVICEDIDDIDDLLVCLEQKSKVSPFAQTLLDIFKSFN